MDPFRADRLLAIVALTFLGVGCVYVLWPFMSSLAWAAILASTCWPLLRWLDHLLGGRRVLAADIRSLQAFNPEEIFSAEVAAIVRQSLDRLPELTREVFVARRFEELSYKEIAEKYGITVRRVEFELEKAVKQLRVALKDYLPVLLMLLSDNILRS